PEAQAKTESFIKKYPQSPLLPSLENIQGLIFLKIKNPAEAANHFKNAIDPNPTFPKYNQFIFYNLATAEYEAGQLENASQSLLKINLEDLDAETRTKVIRLKATLTDKKST